jgi:hypothetical protein
MQIDAKGIGYPLLVIVSMGLKTKTFKNKKLKRFIFI